MAKLPAWDDNTERGNRRMLTWLNVRLDEHLYRHPTEQELAEFETAWENLTEEVEEAKKRQKRIVAEQRRLIGILKASELFPSSLLAPLEAYVEGRAHPKGPRGRPAKTKTQRREHGSPVWLAAADVPRIRELWREHYGRYRRAFEQASAEDFAAARWGVDADSVTNLLKRPRSDPRRLDVD